MLQNENCLTFRGENWAFNTVTLKNLNEGTSVVLIEMIERMDYRTFWNRFP